MWTEEFISRNSVLWLGRLLYLPDLLPETCGRDHSWTWSSLVIAVKEHQDVIASLLMFSLVYVVKLFQDKFKTMVIMHHMGCSSFLLFGSCLQTNKWLNRIRFRGKSIRDLVTLFLSSHWSYRKWYLYVI